VAQLREFCWRSEMQGIELALARSECGGLAQQLAEMAAERDEFKRLAMLQTGQSSANQ